MSVLDEIRKAEGYLVESDKDCYCVYLVTSFVDGAWNPEFHFYKSSERFADNDGRICVIPNKRLPSVYCGTVELADEDFPIRYPLVIRGKILYPNAKLHPPYHYKPKPKKEPNQKVVVELPKVKGLAQTPSIRKRVYQRDGHKCLACGAVEELTLDHIIPRSKGGDNSFDNLQTLCWDCNNKKDNRIRDYRLGAMDGQNITDANEVVLQIV